MRISVGIAVVVAVVTLVAVVLVGQALIQPNLPLIGAAGFSLEKITPNADGSDDVTEFSYTLSRNAQISLYFESEDGKRYFFRQDEVRTAADYQVLFSGVVDGYNLPNETVAGEIRRRLMPDGRYTWHLQARDDNGAADEKTGSLVIENGDAALPELQVFDVSPNIFTPNQDGISDRVQINVYLTKAAELSVYLQTPDGQTIFVPELQECRKEGEPGRHCFDYDGGIDLGVEPPPDGTYTVMAVAQDAVGQRLERSGSVTLLTGGDPQAEIAPQPDGVDVVFTTRPYDEAYLSSAEQMGNLIAAPDYPDDLGFRAISMPVGDLLVFKLTVENYGKVPIRTSGPWPGTVYQQDQIWGAMGIYEESGSWRVGIQCSTTTTSFPWRWGVGSPDTLMTDTDPTTGKVYYYLPAGAKSVVWGAVRMTDLIEARNPQQCWAGLIHEDVEVSVRNARVGARDVELVAETSAAGS